MDDKIRIGIIRAAADRGWARVAHIPAVAAIPSLELHAVATTSQTSADLAAAAFGVERAFGDPNALIDCNEVDAVVVAVKVTAHRDLVERALRRGKPVYCEWPLGRSLTETKELAKLASSAGIPTMIGLQGRSSPWVSQLKSLIGGGKIGRVLSTTLLAADGFSSGTVEQGNAYMLDAANGANPLTIHGGHFVDTLCHVLGELTNVTAVVATSRPSVLDRDTGERVLATSPDQIAIAGLLGAGIVASIHIRAGEGAAPATTWEIQGESGTLRVTAPGYMHWHPLLIEHWDGATDAWTRLSAPDGDAFPSDVQIGPGPAQNVAYHYAAFARAIRTGAPGIATFSDAWRRHRSVQAVADAANHTLRQSAGK